MQTFPPARNLVHLSRYKLLNIIYLPLFILFLEATRVKRMSLHCAGQSTNSTPSALQIVPRGFSHQNLLQYSINNNLSCLFWVRVSEYRPGASQVLIKLQCGLHLNVGTTPLCASSMFTTAIQGNS